MTIGQGRQTRARILAAAEAFLGEHGYHGTRLHHIAQRVGIQKASLFHYFPNKEHLYGAVIAEGLGETEHTIRCALEAEGGPLEKLGTLIGAYVDMVAAHPERTKILVRQSLGDAPNGHRRGPDPQRLLNLVVEFIADGQRMQVFAPIDPLTLVLGVVGMVAFFFTSAPVIAPEWCVDRGPADSVDRVKRHVLEVVKRCLMIVEPMCADSDSAAPA